MSGYYNIHMQCVCVQIETEAPVFDDITFFLCFVRIYFKVNFC